MRNIIKLVSMLLNISFILRYPFLLGWLLRPFNIVQYIRKLMDYLVALIDNGIYTLAITGVFILVNHLFFLLLFIPWIFVINKNLRALERYMIRRRN